MNAAALCCGLLMWASPGAAATPPLVVPDGQLGAAGSRVHGNLLLDLSVTFVDAGAAYRDNYDGQVEYGGYFNPRMCYRYPAKRRSETVTEPDLDPRKGHFSIASAADAQHECTEQQFSGNFLNWASMSTLDLLRSGLTGGDRVIDEAGLTILQRAWLPDGASHPDFYAHPVYFPRKVLAAAGNPGKVTPFSADPLYVVSCRNRIMFSTSKTGSDCDAARFDAGGALLVSDKFFGEFNLRVQVCDSADSKSRPDLCRKYGGGAKPEGGVQRQSAGVRLGLMSYLTGQGAGDANLYGGVLRAPLKFLGASKFDAPDFSASPNDRAEWRVSNGVLQHNPDAGPASLSGTINYINQLGRSHAAHLGSYKASDPTAELYYESLRYLQGRDPSSGAGTASRDANFAVWQTRADPITATCQRNAVALIGHASALEDRYLPGNTRNDHRDNVRDADGFVPGAAFNVMQAARRVGDMEADPAGAYANSLPRPDLLRIDTMDDGPSGAGTYYVAGAAFWAHTNAIRPDKPVQVDHYALQLGESPAGGALYLAAKYGGFNDRNADANPFITAGKAANNTEWSGDGISAAHFYSGGPHSIVANARAMLADAAAPSALHAGNGAMVLPPGGNGFLVETSYDEPAWSGSVRRLALSVDAGGALHAGEHADWDAADILDGDELKTPPVPARPAPSERRIYTMMYRPDKSTTTIAFQWEKLPDELRAALDRAPAQMVPDGLGEQRTGFLRGERTRETGHAGGIFRRRASVLGDAIHATPLVVGAPSASVQGPGYASFHASHRTRRAAVYVGANDGMLHAFDATSGAELFAYVPNVLVPALNALTSPGYQHRPYVDGPASAGEALIDGRWASVLVAGMGMGAQGVFALDISDPAAFETGRGALWEFTDRDDAAMGNVNGAPHIAKLRVGMNGVVPVYRYFALVASGINNYARDEHQGNASGVLFLLALDKAQSAPWAVGVNYYKLTAPASDSAIPNMLAAPGIVTGADGSASFAYAGDLQGNLWRFDFKGGPPWSNAVGPGKGKRPLFVARDQEDRRQPITQAPKIVFAPGGGYLVLFGTGKFIETIDTQPSGFTPQSFYAVHDSLATPAVLVGARSELAARTLSGNVDSVAGFQISGAEFVLTGKDAKRGWYFDFPHAALGGERSVSSAASAAGALFIDSLVPGRDACMAPGTRGYVLDALSGLAFNPEGAPESGAMSGDLSKLVAPASPVLLNVSTTVAPRSATGRAEAKRTLAVVHIGGDGKLHSKPVTVTLTSKRMSWREVANWQELHDAAK